MITEMFELLVDVSFVDVWHLLSQRAPPVALARAESH
jgi:hypothetical protein